MGNPTALDDPFLAGGPMRAVDDCGARRVEPRRDRAALNPRQSNESFASCESAAAIAWSRSAEACIQAQIPGPGKGTTFVISCTASSLTVRPHRRTAPGMPSREALLVGASEPLCSGAWPSALRESTDRALQAPGAQSAGSAPTLEVHP